MLWNLLGTSLISKAFGLDETARHAFESYDSEFTSNAVVLIALKLLAYSFLLFNHFEQSTMATSLAPDKLAYQEAHIDDDRGPQIISVSIFLIVITSVVIVLRFMARKARRLPYEWDDWLSVGGLIFTILTCVVNIVSVHYGLGRHLIATNPKTGYIIFKAGFFLSVAYTLAHFFIKMSILFLYKRIFTTLSTWFRLGLYFCMAYVSAWAFGIFVTLVSQW